VAIAVNILHRSTIDLLEVLSALQLSALQLSALQLSESQLSALHLAEVRTGQGTHTILFTETIMHIHFLQRIAHPRWHDDGFL